MATIESDDDWVYGGDVTLPRGGTREEAPSHIADELPVVDTEEVLPVVNRSDEPPLGEDLAEQIPVGLPVEKSAEPARIEKAKKKSAKRQRTEPPLEKRKGLLTGRQSDQRDVVDVDDKKVCAEVLYSLKHPKYSEDVPPLSELEENEAYMRYARSQMKSLAFLNTMIFDYQRKINENRHASEQVWKLKAEVAQQCSTTILADEQLKKKKKENEQLQAELAKARSLIDKQSVELKALEEYSREAKARADRLRERLLYLDAVKIDSKRADQARATVKCLHNLVAEGQATVKQDVLEDMATHVTGLEAKVKEVEPVELEEGDLSPLGDIPGSRVSLELDETMRDMSEEEQVPAASRSHEEEGEGDDREAE